MSTKNRCCVPSCDRLEPIVRRFPIYYEHVYNTWVDRVGMKKLSDMHPKNVYKSYYVCNKHFSVDCRVPGSKKLKVYSVPTLFLPGGTYTQCFVLPSASVSTNDSAMSVDPVPCVSQDHDYVATTSDSSAHMENDLSRIDSTLDSVSCGLDMVHDHDYVATTPASPARTENDLSRINSTGLETPCRKRQRRVSIRDNSTVIRRNKLLKEIRTKQVNLTPRKRYLYQTASKLRAAHNRVQKRCLAFKDRLNAAESFTESAFYKNMLDNLDKTTFGFIMCQLRNRKLKPKGRRFTTEDKIMALSLYKQSGKGYRLLAKMFALPSRKTMMSLLTKVPFNTGVNSHILENLKKTVRKLKLRDRKCVLIFDEMSIAPHLQYNKYRDEVDGFEDQGSNSRKGEFANHALVFMVRGIGKCYKQPVAYFFTSSHFKSIELVRIIKKIVRAVRQTGLKIVATVSDQAQTNQSAINQLKKDSEAEYLRKGEEYRKLGYEIDNKEIVHLFDAPHLLKGVRNNMLTKHVSFKQENKNKLAKWDHVEELYALDKNSMDTNFKLCPKLTDFHVVKEKIKKMKVSYAAQVMSQRVSAIMRKFAELSETYEKKILDPAATDTADFLLFIDQLFDSVNGSSVYPKNGKLLRCAVTRKSKHIDFWNDALKLLSTTKFVCPKTNRESVPPSIANWIRNLKCLKYITENLLNEGFKFVNLRNFNQDPLENYFGQIRSHGARNINPTAANFRASFKSLLLSNFVSPHSVGANCEEEETDGALSTLQDFVTSTVPMTAEEDQPEVPTILLSEDNADNTVLAEETLRYVAGYIGKQVLKKIQCTACQNDIIDLNSATSQLINCREYRKGLLCNPTVKFFNFIELIRKIFYNNINQIYYKPHISLLATRIITGQTENVTFICPEHNIFYEAINITIKFLLFAHLKEVNKILCGKLHEPATTDRLKLLAVAYYKKKEHIRKK